MGTEFTQRLLSVDDGGDATLWPEASLPGRRHNFPAQEKERQTHCFRFGMHPTRTRAVWGITDCAECGLELLSTKSRRRRMG